MRGLPVAMALALVAACSRTSPREAPPEREGLPRPVAEAAEPTPSPVPVPDVASDDSERARALRFELVRQIATFDRPWGSEAWDERVLEAMRRVPRHAFVPGVSLRTAYMDQPQPIGHGQTISQPTVVALMTQALRLTGREKVLEIGTGSGYQAAILSLCAREVLTIELLAPLGEVARERLRAMGYRNVKVRVGDGYAGWPDEAPFDRILVTAAPPEMPAELLRELAAGGLIVAPVGDLDQTLERWTKRGARFEREKLGGVRFVPMVPGVD